MLRERRIKAGAVQITLPEVNIWIDMNGEIGISKISNTGSIQFQRRRYWLFKYLEAMKGSSCEAIVLDSRRDFYSVLMKDYMLEWKIPAGNMKLKPGDLVHVTIQHADARRNQLSLFV